MRLRMSVAILSPMSGSTTSSGILSDHTDHKGVL